MKYRILRTEKADVQMHEIINYIAADSHRVDAALSYLDKFEHAINLLEDQPYYGVESRHAVLKRQKFHVLIVEKYSVLYKVRERDKTVIIYAVVDSRMDYVNLIL